MTTLMAMTPVKSSAMDAYGIDHEAGRVSVQFKSGHVLEYAVSDAKIREAFDAAPSKGEFYSREIRGRYQGVMVTGDCPDCGAVGILGNRCSDCGCAQYAARPYRNRTRAVGDSE